jgi:signal transduction histidine kinase
VLVIVPPWLASIVLPALSPAGQWMPALVWATILVVAAGYAAYLLGRPRRPALLVGPLAATSLVLGAASPVGLSLAGYPLVASWLNLSCVVVGALLPRGRFIAAGVLTVAGSLGALALRQAWAGTPVAPSDLAAIATFSIGDLFLLGLPTGILRRTAARADAAAAGAAAAAEARVRAEARQGEHRRTARLLHDTVVNTLGAIARWGRADRATVVQRCAADLELLRTVQDTVVGDPRSLMAEVSRRAEVLGVRLEVSVAQVGPPLTADIAEALVGALTEALTNVHKHSGAATARLVWRWDGRDGSVEVSDDGVGFDPSAGAGWRGGAAESIGARCRDAGITVSLASRPGAGTRVTLRWGAATAPPVGGGAGAADPPAVPDELAAISAETVASMALVIGVVGAVATLAMPAGLPRASSLAAVGLVASVGLGARMTARPWSGRLPGAVYPVLAALGAWLPGLGQTGCVRTGIWWWGGMVGFIVAVAAILLDGRRAVVVGSAVGVGVGMLAASSQIGPGNPSCVHEAQALLGLYAAALLAVVAYRNTLARAWRAWASQEAAMRADLAEVMRAEEAGRTRRDLLGVARTIAEPVLSGVASGRLDPSEPDVRARSALAEATLRVLGTLSTATSGDEQRKVTSLALEAHERGIVVHLVLAIDPGQPAALVARGIAMLGVALSACPDHSTARVTILQSGDGLAAMVLVDLPEGRDAPGESAVASLAARLSDEGWSTTVAGDQVLAEAFWDVP